MISVILIWLYMAASAFLLGYGILTLVGRLSSYEIKKRSSYLVCGLAAAAVYAQFFSLFAKVGFAANLVLVVICLVTACFCGKRLIGEFKNELAAPRGGNRGVNKAACGKIIFTLFLFLLYAYGTSRGIIHYDTGLYHAQSIRWIEEYGAVKGLGNLHCRLAYNSAAFALSALYSMAFVTGQSYHCVTGFLALLLASVCFEITGIFKRKYIKPSDFARVMGIYYLINIFDEMISPASDYFMTLTAFYIVIRFMDLLEEREEMAAPYALLGVLCVFLMTLKLSAALLILLTVKPAVMLIKEKKWKEIALYLFMGALTAAPFLIRNVVLSGWLVYPFTAIDFFNVDWKIPEGAAAYDAKEIQVWGRGYDDVSKYDMPFWEWLPDWFKKLGGTDKVFAAAAFASCVVCVLRIIWYTIQKHMKKQNKLCVSPDNILLEATLALSFLFWLFTSPLFRYGCVYVYLTTAVVWGDILAEFFAEEGRRMPQSICIALVALFLVYKAAALVGELAASYVNDYWLCQKDYDNYETAGYEIDGITFYYPLEGDRVGYESFPSSPAKADIELRGSGLMEGFRAR